MSFDSQFHLLHERQQCRRRIFLLDAGCADQSAGHLSRRRHATHRERRNYFHSAAADFKHRRQWKQFYFHRLKWNSRKTILFARLNQRGAAHQSMANRRDEFFRRKWKFRFHEFGESKCAAAILPAAIAVISRQSPSSGATADNCRGIDAPAVSGAVLPKIICAIARRSRCCATLRANQFRRVDRGTDEFFRPPSNAFCCTLSQKCRFVIAPMKPISRRFVSIENILPDHGQVCFPAPEPIHRAATAIASLRQSERNSFPSAHPCASTASIQ